MCFHRPSQRRDVAYPSSYMLHINCITNIQEEHAYVHKVTSSLCTSLFNAGFFSDLDRSEIVFDKVSSCSLDNLSASLFSAMTFAAAYALDRSWVYLASCMLVTTPVFTLQVHIS